MSLIGPPLVGEDGKLNNRLDAAWVNKAAAALHYLETHGGNIKEAMKRQLDDPRFQEEESSYWQHELKALNEAFQQTGVPETGWKIPVTPSPDH